MNRETRSNASRAGRYQVRTRIRSCGKLGYVVVDRDTSTAVVKSKLFRPAWNFAQTLNKSHGFIA